MLKKYLLFNLIFALIFMVQVYAEARQLDWLRSISKPAIVSSLLIFLISSTRLKGRFHKRMFAGLIFALAGDVLLLYAGNDTAYFMKGLVAFLIGHICYTGAFYLDFKSAPELDKKGARIAIAVCGVLAITFYFYLRPYLAHMKLPVMIYILVISMMMMMASFRNLRVNPLSFNLILMGAALFLISDAILAYNKFVHQIDYAGVWIMIPYMLAQYLLTMGTAERKLLH